MEQYVFKNQKQLRKGITTGSCAAAAAEAAASLLLLGIKKETVMIDTPEKNKLAIPVVLNDSGDEWAEFLVRKDSGDDPDVTDKAEIFAQVRLVKQEKAVSDLVFCEEAFPFLYLDGGEGIGRVTRRGLEQRIGQAAINRVPRNMIFQAVEEVRRRAGYEGKLMIQIRVPKGRELAEKTFNPKLGILGGISILGTTGIIEPMSERAIVDVIQEEITQLAAEGVKNLLIMPGNYGKGYVSDYLGMEPEEGVKCSNYIGEALDMAVSAHMESVLLAGHIGKLVKLAAGIMNTHSKVADGRREILALHTLLCGGKKEMAEQIMACIGTEEIIDLLAHWNLKEAVVQSVCRKIREYVTERTGKDLKTGIVLFSEKHGFLGQTEGTEEVIRLYRKERRPA